MRFKPLLVFAICALSISAAQAHELQTVIFAHGYGVTAEMYEAIPGLKRLFEKQGFDLKFARTPFADSIEKRAAILDTEVRRLAPATGKFHLMAHSMGGLDSRLALRDCDWRSRVISLTTLSTPHHGTRVADWVVEHFDRNILRGMFGDELDSARDLTTKHMMEVFNPAVPDVPGVKYMSVGFYIPEPVAFHSFDPLLWFTHGLQPQDNDGLVSTESAKWGEYLGSYPSDHGAETAPWPFKNGPSYRRIFTMVLNELNRRFPNGQPAAEAPTSVDPSSQQEQR